MRTAHAASIDTSKLASRLRLRCLLAGWVAEEKDYFRDEGLDYVFQELIKSSGAHTFAVDLKTA